jgi:hypothetical protein
MGQIGAQTKKLELKTVSQILGCLALLFSKFCCVFSQILNYISSVGVLFQEFIIVLYLYSTSNGWHSW